MPTFDKLWEDAQTLSRCHATTQAYNRALHPDHINISGPPQGSPWTASSSGGTSRQSEGQDKIDLDQDIAGGLGGPPASHRRDVTLANASLFMRDAVWWREVRNAVADGDPGRIWEIFKIWIFTFAGSGNPLYSQFLLELYCNFKWEYKPELREAIFKNWLVNLHGAPGHFIEMDLMQEHFNFWLEEMAQHKGKEFNEPFYRDTLSMNVHHFLHLKDEMEAAVTLEARTKKHSAPHLNNELQSLMTELRDKEVNYHRDGRQEGQPMADDFEKGLETLKKDKIKNFVAKSLVYSNVLKLHNEPISAPMDVDLEEEEVEDYELETTFTKEKQTAPPPRVASHNGDYYMMGKDC